MVSGAEGRAPSSRLVETTTGLPARTALLFLGDNDGSGARSSEAGWNCWPLAASSSETAPGPAITRRRTPIRRSAGRLATAAFRDAMLSGASDRATPRWLPARDRNGVFAAARTIE
jgi:hypothetical protein